MSCNLVSSACMYVSHCEKNLKKGNNFLLGLLAEISILDYEIKELKSLSNLLFALINNIAL